MRTRTGRDVRVSVMFGQAPVDLTDLRRFAELVSSTPAHRLWQGQTLVVDPHQSFAHLVGMGLSVPFGTAVTLMAQRHPVEAALQARSLALASGQPYVLGVGPGSAQFQRCFLGAPYPSVLTACHEYVAATRALLRGETPGSGTYFHGGHPIAPVDTPPVEVGLGVLRPRMAQLAGEVADAAITWLTPPGYLRGTIIPALRDGSRRAGRPRPRLVAMTPVVLDRPGRHPTRYLLAGNAGHLSQPQYRSMLASAGVLVPKDQPAAAVRPMVESGAFLFGSPNAARQRLEDLADAGADEIVLNLTAVHHLEGAPSALADARTVLDAVS